MSNSEQKPASDPAQKSRHLDKPLLKSLAWTGSIKWACQIVTWVFTLVVARILSPDDYGLMAIATIYLVLVTMLSEFGLGKALVVIPKLDSEQVAQINGLAIMFGITGMSISWIFAGPAGQLFFDDVAQANKLTEVIRVLSVTFIIGSLRTIPFALLEKDLRFKALALTDGGRALATATTTLSCALLGFGYWALVAGLLVDSIIASIMGLILRRHRFAWPRLRAIRSVVQVSWHFVVDIISYNIYKSADQAIAGKVLGTAPLGVYALAIQLANMPVDKIASIVGRITPAFFAAVGDDPAGLRRYLLVLSQGLALIIFPLACGIALVADEFVLVALGEKWAAMIVPLKLLAISSAFTGVFTLMPRVLWATGNTGFTMWTSFATAVIMIPAFYIGSFWGTEGIALAWIVAFPLLQTPVYWLAFKKIDLRLTAYLRALWPAFSSCVLMAGALLTLDSLLPASFSLVAMLITKIAVGAATYGATILLAHRDTAAVALKSFRQLSNKTAEAPSS